MIEDQSAIHAHQRQRASDGRCVPGGELQPARAHIAACEARRGRQRAPEREQAFAYGHGLMDYCDGVKRS